MTDHTAPDGDYRCILIHDPERLQDPGDGYRFLNEEEFDFLWNTLPKVDIHKGSIIIAAFKDGRVVPDSYPIQISTQSLSDLEQMDAPRSERLADTTQRPPHAGAASLPRRSTQGEDMTARWHNPEKYPHPGHGYRFLTEAEFDALWNTLPKGKEYGDLESRLRFAGPAHVDADRVATPAGIATAGSSWASGS